MQESIEFLDAVSEAPRSAVISRRNVLRLYAHSITSRARTRERIGDLALRLLEEAKNAEETNTRLRALWMAAHTYRDHSNYGYSTGVGPTTRRELQATLSLEDRAEYALGIATLSVLLRATSRKPEDGRRRHWQLESQGILNSVYLSLDRGLGAILHGPGRIRQRQLLSVKRASDIARKVGDERRLRMLAGNLALSHCRLGNVDSQLEWADRAAAIPASYTGIFEHQQIHYLSCPSIRDAGEGKRSTRGISRRGRDRCSSHSMTPTTGVASSDGGRLSLLGRQLQGHPSAVPGVTGEMSRPRFRRLRGAVCTLVRKVAVAKLSGLGRNADSRSRNS